MNLKEAIMLKNPTITKEDAKKEMQRIVALLGKVPTRQEFMDNRQLVGCHKTALDALFGKNAYNNLILYSGFPVNTASKTEIVQCTCAECGTSVSKPTSTLSPNGTNFCSRSCTRTYFNKHKTTGNRRSKLEEYLESTLVSIYPTLEFVFNDRQCIGYELDIYLPKYKLAFELNGIFHYEPIFGEDKLARTKFNDANKFRLCQEKNISLCVIDTTSQKQFTEKSSKVFLNIITSIIDDAIKVHYVEPPGVEPG